MNIATNAITVEQKAELFDFIMAVTVDDDLAAWMEGVGDEGIIDKEPETIEESTQAFTRLLARAKADGVYPIKT